MTRDEEGCGTLLNVTSVFLSTPVLVVDIDSAEQYSLSLVATGFESCVVVKMPVISMAVSNQNNYKILKACLALRAFAEVRVC